MKFKTKLSIILILLNLIAFAQKALYVPYKKNGKYGLVDSTFKFFVAPEYDQISPFYTYSTGQIGKTSFCIDSTGKVIFSYACDDIHRINDSIFILAFNKQNDFGDISTYYNLYVKKRGLIFPFNAYDFIERRNLVFEAQSRPDDLSYFYSVEKDSIYVFSNTFMCWEEDYIVTGNRKNGTYFLDSSFNVVKELEGIHASELDRIGGSNCFMRKLNDAKNSFNWTELSREFYNSRGELIWKCDSCGFDGGYEHFTVNPENINFDKNGNKQSPYVPSTPEEEMKEEKRRFKVYGLDIVYTKNKVSLLNKEGEVIYKKKKYCFIDVIKSSPYDSLNPNFYLVVEDKKGYRLLDKEGKTIIPFLFKQYENHGDYLIVYREERIDIKSVLKYSHFSGLDVQFGDSTGCKAKINENKVLISTYCDPEGSTFYYVDSTGSKILEKNEFFYCDPDDKSSEVFIHIIIDSLGYMKYGLADTNSKEILPCKYVYIIMLTDSTAIVAQNKPINKNSYIIHVFNQKILSYFPTYDGYNYGYETEKTTLFSLYRNTIDSTGTNVIERAIFDGEKLRFILPYCQADIYRLDDMKFLINTDDYVQIINKEGKVLYHKKGQFRVMTEGENLFSVSAMSRHIEYNHNDKFLVHIQRQPFYCRVGAVNHLQGYIDKKGRVYF